MLDYWQEIDGRLLHALEKYPHIDFQLIPYAEDTEEIRRYADGDRMSLLIVFFNVALEVFPLVGEFVELDGLAREAGIGGLAKELG